MNVGDLIREKGHSDIGLIIEKRDKSDVVTYRVHTLAPPSLASWAQLRALDIHWWPRNYVENDCEVISESR